MADIQKTGGDNVVEDYFLNLLVDKHVIDREIQDLLSIIEKSGLHSDYQILLKKILFGENNIYLENWGTLQTSLTDLIMSMDVRGKEVKSYGIILRIMMRVVEEVFDVGDEHFHDFIISSEKEDIEHRLIILMKRILDVIETGLQDMLAHTELLSGPIEAGQLKDEFIIIKSALLHYPTTIMTSQREAIASLKISVDNAALKIKERKKNLKHLG